MDILECLRQPSQWQRFLEYRTAGDRMPKWALEQLETFVQNQTYLEVLDRMESGIPFPYPKKSAISKMNSEKKRIVYTYPKDENLVLKHMTHLLIRRYDHLFAPNLYSFRAGVGVPHAIEHLTRGRNLGKLWCYKVDIHDYFNSIPVERLLPMLEEVLQKEPNLYAFIADLLQNPLVKDEGQLVSEKKGIMAGTPISTFLANLYLREMDWTFHRENRIYLRYSDDIIIFAPTREQMEADAARILGFLQEAGLTVNPKKESRTSPGEKWVFLGVSYHQGTIDVAPASVEKIKAKMRRKARALKRWADRKGVPGPNAAKAFIRVFNHKLFLPSSEHELTWARWFFPLINTAESLHSIDLYCQQCIRFLATGKHNKSAYNFRYEDMKALGYVNLVHAYYRHRDGLDIG